MVFTTIFVLLLWFFQLDILKLISQKIAQFDQTSNGVNFENLLTENELSCDRILQNGQQF
jgi:hypothetical protein